MPFKVEKAVKDRLTAPPPIIIPPAAAVFKRLSAKGRPMDIKNINVNFTDGFADCVPTVTQYDCGQHLRITGLCLPAVCEFGFKNASRSTLLPVVGIVENGVATTQIPNELLSEGEDITAFIIATKDDSTKTVYSLDLRMRKRAAVDEVSSDPNDPHYVDGLAEVIKSANEMMETAAENVSDTRDAAILAEQHAATAAAIADTLTPADRFFTPDSWNAQSGMAVQEAVLKCYGDLNDEIVTRYMLCLHHDDIDTAAVTDPDATKRVPSVKLLLSSIQSAAPAIEYNGFIYGAKTVSATLDGLMNDVLGLRDHALTDNHLNSEAIPENPSRANVPSSYAVKQYVNGLVGEIEAALDGIIALQNSLIGGEQ